MGLISIFVAVVYVALAVGTLTVIAAAPVYLLLELGRVARSFAARRRPRTRERARAQAELREQYASGMLTLVGLEERLDETFRARTHLELEHVLDDLPARPPELPRAARVEVLAALAIVLVFHSLVARIAGVALGIGAVVPIDRWRAVGYAFLAGVALLTAPLVALPLALCAGRRWRQERL